MAPTEDSGQRVFDYLPALAAILGALIGGGASYLAAREVNRSAIQRDERNEQLDTRAAARLVENELAVIQVRLRFLRKDHLDAASLVKALRKLPKTEWNANEQRLARTLTVRDWGYVRDAYVMTEAFASNARARVIPGVTLGLLDRNVGEARDHLLPYE